MVAAAGHCESYGAYLDGISPAVRYRWMHNNDGQLAHWSLIVLALSYDAWDDYGLP